MRRRGCEVVVLAVLAWLSVASGPAAAGDGGPWVWPVDGTVVRPFAPPTTRYGPGHRGVDLAGPVGTPVRAAGAGRVSYAGLLAGRGVVVVVHGSLRTTYEPVTASVRVGQRVAAGAVIGRLAGGGHCSGGCLHWGLLRGDAYLDPLQLLRRGPARLLPVPPQAAQAALAAGVPGSGAASELRRATTEPSRQPLAAVSDPGFSLRAAELPWGAAAVAALLTGLLLIRPRAPRPPRDPRHRPPETLQPASGDGAATQAQLVDLGAERSRRRIA